MLDGLVLADRPVEHDALARAAKYAREYHVERYLRESFVGRIAPVSRELILCFIAERVLGLPKSY